MPHTFHIPVLGLGYSIDTPFKVARYGISSVVSIVDDELVERMREYYADLSGESFVAIPKQAEDSRARRITAYLNLLDRQVKRQIQSLKSQSFSDDSDLQKYFELLPNSSKLKHCYLRMQDCTNTEEKNLLTEMLKDSIYAGSIDVNIMSKVDKMNYVNGAPAGELFSDALSALRGFANSALRSSLVISAGLNQRLFSYMATFDDFFPDVKGDFNKKVILKVSDYRSAIVQAKILAKKGLWVSEFRVESGLNCGGHAFATDGYLLGPILQEFKENRDGLRIELYQIYSDALKARDKLPLENPMPDQKVTAQGGLGTPQEHDFLIKHYGLDAVGWGSPFLLVPEASSVDESTMHDLARSDEQDFYLSNASPLGVLFNNYRKSSAEQLRLSRIEKGRPGSPCTKKYLCNNTEFTDEPICTASRQYQNLKIRALKSMKLDDRDFQEKVDMITEKQCLCEGLCASSYLTKGLLGSKESKAVSICPGPNLAYFNRIYSLKEMVDHIYGRCNLLKGISRPNLFLKELGLYIDYFKRETLNLHQDLKKEKYLNKFFSHLSQGIKYYQDLIANAEPGISLWTTDQIEKLDQSMASLRINAALCSLP